MFVRLWYISVSPERANNLKQLYHDEVIPTVSSLKGLIECTLLQPVNAGDEFVALTIWKRQSDALVYESGELYEEQRNKVIVLARIVPVLKTYPFEPVAVESLVY